MGEIITRRREKKTLLLSLLIGAIILVVLITSWGLLKFVINSGTLDTEQFRIYSLSRSVVIVLFVIDCFLLVQWISLLIFRSK